MEDKFHNQAEIENYIQTAYDRGGRYLADGKPKYTAHAVRLEDDYGLKGIAGRYAFPGGKAADIAEYDYRKAYLKYSIASEFLKSPEAMKVNAAKKFEAEIPKALKDVNNEIALLAEMNPDLKRLNYNKNNFVETYRALIGITSQYNADDINAYLHNYRTGAKNTEVQNEMERLKKNSGIRFGWQPAMKTIELIDQQLRVREQIRKNQNQR